MLDDPAQHSHSKTPSPRSAEALSLAFARRFAMSCLSGKAANWLDITTSDLAARSEDGDRRLAQALAIDQVDQLVLDTARRRPDTLALPPRLAEILALHRHNVVARTVRQEYTLGELTNLLDEAGAAHVVFKGALVRSLLYDSPHLRPSIDVDLLIAPSNVGEVVRLLHRHGFDHTLAPHSDTHEVGLERNGVDIDLHWRMLRPGRMRQDITAEILSHRVRRGTIWGPGDAHLTVAMLVHPAITDHVTGRLISAIDLDRWVRRAEIPWDDVSEVLGRIGLRVAAWAMLTWTRGLFDTPVPDAIWRTLAPSSARRRYIEAWLARDPAACYQHHPNLVRGAFSLALQDRPTDMARAIWNIVHKDRTELAGAVASAQT